MRNNRGRSFVTIMIVIAFSALLLRTSIEQLLKINIAQNESSALATLKLISTALENYAGDNKGVFPIKFALLKQASPAYLDRDYIAESPIKGYNYSCIRLEPASYSCSALPVKCGFTGKMAYTVATGGAFVSEQCNKKE